MDMEREVEVQLVGAEDIMTLGLFKHLIPLVTVAIAGRPEAFETRPDGRHGDDPRWNERFQFSLPDWLVASSGTRVEVELYNAEAGRQRQHLGTVHIPLQPGRLDGKVHKYSIMSDGNKKGKLLAALHLGNLRPPPYLLQSGRQPLQHKEEEKKDFAGTSRTTAPPCGALPRRDTEASSRLSPPRRFFQFPPILPLVSPRRI